MTARTRAPARTDRPDVAASWAVDPRITPVVLTLTVTAIVLVSVASGALLARELLRRRALEARGYDKETGDPLFI